MKPVLKPILGLAMVLFMVSSCVSSPPPASQESAAEAQAEPLAQTSEAATSPTDTGAGTSSAVADLPTAEQPPQPAPLPELQPTPATGSPSSVPTTPDSGSVPAQNAIPTPGSVPTTTPGSLPPENPQPVPQVAQATPAPKPSPPSPAPVSPVSPVTPVAPASPPPQAAMTSQEKPRQIGEVVFSEGKVSVHRAGKSIMPLDIGDVVYAYDVVMTGPGSLAQVDLGAGRPGGAFIRLSENTAFYFDSKELSAEQRRTVLQILSGSIAVKVERLAGGSFSVASDTAVLGVRGTDRKSVV